ncbi:MarR family winged helix-turn-helix transcriptional regulator [Rhodococcus sp. G-MC3]|uniref:MarR family winged helix-turn-helix transcriptional regulator n=1 Tax=Rhodococcus sp. G-MC3 TaxID=3046209 RepID=UPI0024BAC7E7|nr:MarR family winged helix-turn-helix transcriptional regulator [Rhodococcus sp. G-MC3]MDJ0394309.1 MarR family winged helix-turn-helix transcriptional regulator [Rhodococcus sp. G-MC3]
MTDSDTQEGIEPDLAALLFGVLPHLGALEEPLLREAGLSMWEYAILTEIAAGAAVSQAELSRRTRRDPTRLGKHLNELVSRELVSRERSDDQRQRTVAITPGGQDLLDAVRARIRAVEDDLLESALTGAEASTLRRLLAQLAAACESQGGL